MLIESSNVIDVVTQERLWVFDIFEVDIPKIILKPLNLKLNLNCNQIKNRTTNTIIEDYLSSS